MALSSGGLLNGSNLRWNFSVGGRRNVLEGSDVGGARPGFADHVEFVERLLAVDPHVEDAAGFAAARHVVFAVQRLREVQAQFVYARGQRNVVCERAFAPALVDSGFARAEDRMIVGFKNAPALEIPVALPDPAQAVRVVSVLVPGQNPHLKRIGNRAHDRRRRAGELRGLRSGPRQSATATAPLVSTSAAAMAALRMRKLVRAGP